jgi:hypothetical protein
MPRRLEHLRQSIARARDVVSAWCCGLSILLGMVPTGLTIVGLPFTPVVLLAIVVAWIFGYALGAYSAAMRFGRTKVQRVKQHDPYSGIRGDLRRCTAGISFPLLAGSRIIRWFCFASAR